MSQLNHSWTHLKDTWNLPQKFRYHCLNFIWTHLKFTWQNTRTVQLICTVQVISPEFYLIFQAISQPIGEQPIFEKRMKKNAKKAVIKPWRKVVMFVFANCNNYPEKMYKIICIDIICHIQIFLFSNFNCVFFVLKSNLNKNSICKIYEGQESKRWDDKNDNLLPVIKIKYRKLLSF